MSKHVIMMTIHDVDHYTDEEKQEIINLYPEHERDARSKGIPQLGSGRIFPVSEESITVQDFEVPKHWFLINGIDFGWDHPTAGAQLAVDNDADVIYVVKVYRRKQAVPYEHCIALKKWGDSVPWAWPHDGLQHDKQSGIELRQAYSDEGLYMLGEQATFPNGSVSVEAGIQEILQMMKTERFKVFASCQDFFDEFRTYHRKDGKIVKLVDDIICAVRYAYMMRRFGVQLSDPEYDDSSHDEFMAGQNSSSVSGY